MALTIREKQPGQRACSKKDEKGKLCLGHLKRWYTPPAEVIKEVGKDVEIYRCERCHTLYRPAAGDMSSAGLNYDPHPVNVLGWATHASKK